MVKAQFQKKITINVLLIALVLSFVAIFVLDRPAKELGFSPIGSSLDIKDLDISLKALQEYNTPKGKFFYELSELLKGRYDSPIYSIHRYNMESKMFLLLMPFIFIILALAIYRTKPKTFIVVVIVYSIFSMIPLFML